MTHVEHAEADTFYCFSNLMVEIGDKFTKILDRSRAGIGENLDAPVWQAMNYSTYWFGEQYQTNNHNYALHLNY